MDIVRFVLPQLIDYLDVFPAVGLIGPRQVGKTTLVKALSVQKEVLYLDLEKASDRARLYDTELFLKVYENSLVVLDEVQMMPELFQELRSLIDEKRVPGRFILLGSASPELIRKSSDSLAGRIGYLELTPFNLIEIENSNLNNLWFRGGFPLSYLAKSDRVSRLWRENFVRTYLERDLAILGLNVDFRLMERFLMMVANAQGNLWNAESFARALGVTRPTINKYLHFLEGAFLLRALQPYHNNVKKRLVKSPKVYIRDTGLLHSLVQVDSEEGLQGNLIVGASWESFVIEQIISVLGNSFQYFFYRTHQGAECDLILVRNSKVEYAVEIKNTLSPKISKGFRISMEDTMAKKGVVISRVEKGYPIAPDIEVQSLKEFLDTCIKLK
ncbi:ATP-binding protein [Roseivirga pacifica]